MIGLSLDSLVATPKAFAAKNGIAWTQGHLGEWSTTKVPGEYGVQGIPTMLFISGGKVVHRQVGALPENMLRNVVSQFMEVVATPKA